MENKYIEQLKELLDVFDSVPGGELVASDTRNAELVPLVKKFLDAHEKDLEPELRGILKKASITGGQYPSGEECAAIEDISRARLDKFKRDTITYFGQLGGLMDDLSMVKDISVKDKINVMEDFLEFHTTEKDLIPDIAGRIKDFIASKPGIEEIRAFEESIRVAYESHANYELDALTEQMEKDTRKDQQSRFKENDYIGENMQAFISAKQVEFSYAGKVGTEQVTRKELDELLLDAKAFGVELVVNNVEGDGDFIEVKKNGSSLGVFKVEFGADVPLTRK